MFSTKYVSLEEDFKKTKEKFDELNRLIAEEMISDPDFVEFVLELMAENEHTETALSFWNRCKVAYAEQVTAHE